MGLFGKKEEVANENAILDEKMKDIEGIDKDIQSTFNTDGIDILVEEGEVENVSDENE